MTGPLRRAEWPLHWPVLGYTMHTGPGQKSRMVNYDEMMDHRREIIVRQFQKTIESKGFTTHPDIIRERLDHVVEQWPHNPNDDTIRERLAGVVDATDLGSPADPGETHHYRFPPWHPNTGDPVLLIDGPRRGERREAPIRGAEITERTGKLTPTYYRPVALNTATGEWLYAADDLGYRHNNPVPKEQP